MTAPPATVPVSHFEGLYAADTDPWGFEDRWYEERKRAVTLSALPQRRFGTAYEPGCSIGVLTEALADRCGTVLASDASALALGRAQERLADRPHVRLERRVLPQEWPDGTFDLVVLSEILYYFAADDLSTVTRRAVAAVAAGGTLLAVHWRHPSSGHPQPTARVGRALAAAAGSGRGGAVGAVGTGGLVRTVRHVEDDFDLVVYVRPETGERASRVSVAARSGLC